MNSLCGNDKANNLLLFEPDFLVPTSQDIYPLATFNRPKLLKKEAFYLFFSDSCIPNSYLPASEAYWKQNTNKQTETCVFSVVDPMRRNSHSVLNMQTPSNH